MSASDQHAYAAPPRVDERILGTGTAARFALLLVLMLATTAVMSLQGAAQIFVRREPMECALAAGIDPDNRAGIGWGVATLSQQEPYLACMARNAPPPPWWVPVVWPLLVLVAGAAVFVVRSVFWRGRRRSVPLAVVDHDGELRSVLDEMVEYLRPDRRPRFVVDPAAASASAVVLGRDRRPTVCLHGGLLAIRHAEPERFRAVLLHEIAHVRNGDITLTYFTVAIWRAFVVSTVLPLLVIEVRLIIDWSGALFGASQVTLGVRNLLLAGILVVLVTMARADVLRTREIHADLTALRWGADPQQWSRTADASKKRTFIRAIAGVTEPWHTHPHWRVRRDSLDEPVALFHIRPLPLILTGAAATLINAHLMFSLNWFGIGPFGPVGLWSQQLLTAATAGLVVGVVGIAIWRAVAYAMLTGRPGPSGVRIGFWLGIGMVAGELVTHRASVSSWLPARPAVLILVVLSCVVLMWWIEQSAELGALAWPGRTLGPAMVIGLVAASLALAVWLGWWGPGGGAVLAEGWPFVFDGVRDYLSYTLSGATSDQPAEVSGATVIVAMVATLSNNMLSAPLAPFGIAALWAGPLLAWLARPSMSGPPWMRNAVIETRGGDAGFAFPAPPAPAGLRRMIAPGIVLGILCWGAAILTRAAADAGTADAVRQAADRSIRYLSWLAVGLVVAAAIASIVANLRAGRHRLITSLISGHTAVLTGFVGIAVLLAVDRCARPTDSFWMRCHGDPLAPWPVAQAWLYDFLGPVLVLVTIVAILVASGFAVIDRLAFVRARSSPVAPGGSPSKRRAVVCVVCLAALGISGVQAHRITVGYGVRTDPSVTQQAAQLMLGTAESPTVSANTRAWQIYAWRDNGGEWLIQHIEATRKRYIEAVGELEKEQHSWASAKTRFDPICQEFGRLAGIAETYFRVPEDKTDAYWQVAVDALSTGGQTCQQAMDQQDNSLLRSAHSNLEVAFRDVARAESRMHALEDAG